MQVKALAENFLDKLYTSKMKTKEEEETKSSIWDLKNALPNTNPRTVERYEGGTLYFLLYSLYKTNRFNVALGLFSDRSQRRQNVVNISDRLACGSCTTSLFLPHFDVICDLLLIRRTE